MKIVSLHCVNFKLFEDAEFLFGDSVYVQGDNFRGKTSIPEATSVALFGTTLSGSPQTDHLIRKGAKEYEVTAVIEVNGVSYEIVRVKGKKNEVFLDGAKSTQAEVEKLIGQKERFLAVFIPGYFTALSDKEAREMLMSLIRRPEQSEVIAKLTGPEQTLLKNENLRDPEGLAKQKRSEIKDAEAEANKTEGRLEVLREQASREIPEPMKFDYSVFEKLKTELDSKTTGNAIRIKELRTELAALGREYDMVKKSIQPLPNAPYNEGDECPTCGRSLEGDSLDHALAFHKSQLAQVDAKNADFHQRALALVDKGKIMRAELERLEDEHIATSADDLKAQIAELEAQKSQVELHNGHAARLRIEQAEAQDNITKCESYLDEIRKEQDMLAETIKAIGSYRAKLAEIQVEQLKQHLKRVDIELFKVTKTTGEIKDCFTVTYDGKEFKSLSYSEGIRANLEFSTLFNKVLETDYPVYIDNGESITHFDTPAASQIFVAKVVPGKELTVESDVKAEGVVA